MAELTMFMSTDLSRPVPPVFFATDARGAEGGSNGAYAKPDGTLFSSANAVGDMVAIGSYGGQVVLFRPAEPFEGSPAKPESRTSAHPSPVLLHAEEDERMT